MKLKEYLDKNYITYQEFANLIGVKNRQSISQYINGIRIPSKNILEKIYIITQGQVQPIDFLFLYKEQIDFVSYVKDKIDKKIIF